MDQFSNDFASHWDELVGWEKRSAADTSFLFSLIEKYRCRRVLDAALGTGFHSIKLLQAGLAVKSVDISQAMIDVAQRNAERHEVQLDVICSDWIDLNAQINEKFDCILCLGNSLACEMEFEKRQLAISNWNDLLADDGIIIVDRRNYEAMLAGHYNFEAKGQYCGESVKIASDKITSEETVFSYTFADGRTFDLRMYPILDEQLRTMCANVGLQPTEVFGDRQTSFNPRTATFYQYVLRRVNNA